MIDLRQTGEYANYLRKLGWVVERENGVSFAIKNLPIVGSIIKLQRPERLRNKEIKILRELSDKYRTFHIIIEPSPSSKVSLLTSHNFHLSSSPSLPSKTIHIDLKKSERQLLSEMHHKTRYNIKVAEKRGIEIKTSKEIEDFSRLWHESARRRGMFFSLRKEILALYEAFEEKSNLLFAYHKRELVAAVFLVYSDEVAYPNSSKTRSGQARPKGHSGDNDGVAYYMYAAASDAGKKVFAPTFIVWEAIKLAKRKQYKVFDFEGIYDERFPLNSWKGFSRFKKSFGGREVEYPGSFVKFVLPFRLWN